MIPPPARPWADALQKDIDELVNMSRLPISPTLQGQARAAAAFGWTLLERLGGEPWLHQQLPFLFQEAQP